jgi:hypothetical protein
MNDITEVQQAPKERRYPKSISDSVKLICVCLALSFLSMTLDVLFSGLESSTYFAQLVGVVLYLVFPYKILQGKDIFRFMFVVVEGVSLAIYLTSEVNMPPFSIISTFIQFPLLGLTFYLLFCKQSNDWFASFKTKNNNT